jgi:hypothetical protein
MDFTKIFYERTWDQPVGSFVFPLHDFRAVHKPCDPIKNSHRCSVTHVRMPNLSSFNSPLSHFFDWKFEWANQKLKYSKLQIWSNQTGVLGMRALQRAERTRRGCASISAGQIRRGWPAYVGICVRHAEATAGDGGRGKEKELNVPSRQRGERDGVRACTTSRNRELGVSAHANLTGPDFFLAWGPMRCLNCPFFASKPAKRRLLCG